MLYMPRSPIKLLIIDVDATSLIFSNARYPFDHAKQFQHDLCVVNDMLDPTKDVPGLRESKFKGKDEAKDLDDGQKSGQQHLL